jgi:alpha-L-fucosidase
MGDWLRVNGESIYDTRPGPLQGLEWCRTTVSTIDPNTVYVHIFDWPHDGLIRLVGLPRPAAGAYLLADPARTALPVTHQDGAVLIHGPAQAPDPIDTVLVLKLA